MSRGKRRSIINHASCDLMGGTSDTMRIRLILFAVSAAALHAQAPFIYYRGVVNVANYMPPGLPSGGIAQGAQFSIFGSALGPATSPPLAFPLSTTLAGVSISVTQGTTTV